MVIKSGIIFKTFTGQYDRRNVLVIDEALAGKRCPDTAIVEARRIRTVDDIFPHMQMVAMRMRQAQNGDRAIGVPCFIGLRSRQNLGQDECLQLKFVEFERIGALHWDETFQKNQERSSKQDAAAANGALRQLVGRVGPTRIVVSIKTQMRRKRYWRACQPLFLKWPVMLADAS